MIVSMHRRRRRLDADEGRNTVAIQRDRDQCFIQVEAAVVNRMSAMRRPGESYSEVILRLVELEAGRRWA